LRAILVRILALAAPHLRLAARQRIRAICPPLPSADLTFFHALPGGFTWSPGRGRRSDCPRRARLELAPSNKSLRAAWEDDRQGAPT
jgi:hypothetical protein